MTSLEVAAAGHTPRNTRWGGLADGVDLDLGEVELTPGFEVKGRVAGRDGAPLEGVTIHVKGVPQSLRPGEPSWRSLAGTSNAQGELTIRGAVPPGTWELAANGGRLVAPPSITVHAVRGAPPLAVLAEAAPMITGIVVDDHGRPVSGVGLRASSVGAPLFSSARTGADGRFVLRSEGDGTQPAAILVDDPGPCEPWRGRESHSWGSRDVRIELVRALELELTVVEKGSGRPVESYSVRCHATRLGSPPPAEARLAGHHEKGRLTVDRILRGENVLVVLPEDPALERGEPVRFQAAAGQMAPLRVELVRLTDVPIVVARKDGTRVAGTRLELVRDAPTGPRAVPPLGPRDPLSRAKTDAEGRATLKAPEGDPTLTVRVLGPGHLPAAVRLAVPFPEEPQRVEVDAGATLVGKLGPEAVLAWKPTIELRPATGGASAAARIEPVPVGFGGTFRVDAVPPGEWVVVPVITIATRTGTTGSAQRTALEGADQRVELAEGGKRELTLDATEWLPARLAGIVTLGDRPAAGARVVLTGTNRGQRWRCGTYLLDATGRFQAKDLPPGVYRVELLLGNPSGAPGRTLVHEEELEIGPGKSVTRELRFRGE
jgi:hypothetical protein